MIITVIGSVDTGKTSLISRILIETGSVNNREVNKAIKDSEIMKKPNQWLPILIDTNHEEKAQNIIIESSIESFIYKDRKYQIINNPGHTSFINEMIKHSSISDIGILVISAKTNELSKSIINGFEHALILRVNGIKTLIICINKCEYIHSITNSFGNIINEINKTIKKLKFDKIIHIPVSAKLNLNIIKNDSNLVKYSLLDIIGSINSSKRDTTFLKPFENTVKARLIFHKIQSIISVGYTCLLHSLDKTYDVEFISIKNDDINFVTSTNSINKVINCILKITTNDHIDINCILRHNDMTIAYGILYK